ERRRPIRGRSVIWRRGRRGRAYRPTSGKAPRRRMECGGHEAFDGRDQERLFGPLRRSLAGLSRPRVPQAADLPSLDRAGHVTEGGRMEVRRRDRGRVLEQGRPAPNRSAPATEEAQMGSGMKRKAPRSRKENDLRAVRAWAKRLARYY